MRSVVDTGVLVSGMIRPEGTTGDVLLALRDGRFIIVYSVPILMEIIEVLGRASFRLKYHIHPEDITILVNLVRLRGELVSPGQRVTVCRDPADNKFLEAAWEGAAECIVSGDADLLDLSPFEGVPILRPSEFLARLS